MMRWTIFIFTCLLVLAAGCKSPEPVAEERPRGRTVDVRVGRHWVDVHVQPDEDDEEEDVDVHVTWP